MLHLSVTRVCLAPRAHLTCVFVLFLAAVAVVNPDVDCGPPPSLTNAVVVTNGTTHMASATYTCQDGYLADPWNVSSTCQSNGTWTTATIDCVAIDCGPPPNVRLAFQDLSNFTGYLNKSHYQCYSGHAFQTTQGVHSSFTLTCAAEGGAAAWVGAANDAVMQCSRIVSYEGCYSGGQNITVIGYHGIAACRRNCLALDKTYSYLRGAECACADVNEKSAVDDAECSMACVPAEGSLCGGDPDLWTVYTTFHGCFSNLSDDGRFQSFNELTCNELCRGEDSRYAAYFPANQTCACLNSTEPNAIRKSHGNCERGKMPSVATVKLLTKVAPLEVSTCKELFALDVHVHGKYYLAGDVNAASCHFYDGSAECEMDWLSYNGHCYYMGQHTATATMDEAWDYCMAHNSLLLSINDEAEAEFTRIAINSITAFRQADSWYIGLYDHFRAFAHQWLDGSLLTFSQFVKGKPNSAEYNCVTFLRSGPDGLQEWYDSICSSLRSFVCERPVGVYGCVTMPATGYTPVHTLVDEQLMTLTLCFETCRSRGAVYAAVTGTTCLCLTSLPSHTQVPWEQCGSSRCIGNWYQPCGAPVSSSGDGNLTAFVIQDADQKHANSCRSLQLQGITGSNLTIDNHGVPTIMDCTNLTGGVECPYSWATLEGRCYKFFPRTSPTPAEVCASMGGYLVVLDDALEQFTVFNDSAVLQGFPQWLVGLFTMGSNIAVFRSSNGRVVQGLMVPDLPPGSMTCVGIDVSDGSYDLLNANCGTLPFICEKGPDYVGCGVLSANDTTLVLDDYPEMSVTQCVELCRGRRDRFALPGNNPFRCYCTSVLPQSAPVTACTEFCFPGHGQACGGIVYDQISVYDVDQFPPFATNCSDLFDADVQVPGTYLIDGNFTDCYMKDNSSCSSPDSSWEGVGVEGACFKWSLYDVNGMAALATCKGLSPAHLPASVHTEQELAMLGTLYDMMKNAHEFKCKHLGGVDQFQMGTFTWADGWLMTFTATSASWVQHFPRLNYGQSGVDKHMSLSSYGLFKNLDNDKEERRLICREVADDLGCFANPNSLTAVVSNYSSIGVPLCKQTCLARNASVALLDTASCYCLNDSDALSAASQNQTGCDVACPSNPYQICASPGFLRAYRVDTRDVAESCETLHANFVVLSNTYMLRDKVTGDLATTTCGFADTTPCPAGFLGNKGKCYRFFPWAYMTTELAAQQCRSVAGYLATPNDLEELTFVQTVIRGIPSLATLTGWRLGVTDILQGESAASSDGSLMTSPLWNLTSLPGDGACTTVNVSQGTIGKGDCLSTLPFVCETGPVFLGCRSFPSGMSATFDLSLTSGTVQQCVALCYGQDARYALLTTTTCSCVSADVMAASDVADCSAACDDYFTQVCGSDDASVYAVYDVDAYVVSEKTAASCVQLRQWLVTAKGQYYLYLSDNSRLAVTCGAYGVGHEDILALEAAAAQYKASSLDTTAADARLSIYSATWTHWQPSSDDANPWIQVTLSDYYVIKAVAITGSSSSGGGHVTELLLSHRFSAAGPLTPYNSSLSGPSQRTELAMHYLTAPVVAKVIRLQPTQWSVAPSLAFTLIGQRYTSFNHSDLYIGCFADHLNDTLVSLTTPSSLEECKERCDIEGYPLFGLVQLSGIDTCGCSRTAFANGELDVTFCNAICVSAQCGSDVTVSVAVYVTYELQCQPPPQVFNATQTLTSLVPTPDDVYSFGSTVTYTCLRGYEFQDLTTSVTITCQGDKTWSQTPPSACQIMQCGVPVDITNGNVTFNDVIYGSVANYMCDQLYETADSLSVVTTVCTENKTWSPPAPVCSPKTVRHSTVCLSSRGRQLSGSPVTLLTARSSMDCARHCTHVAHCSLYSFRSDTAQLPEGADNCNLYLGKLSDLGYVVDSAWNVYDMDSNC